MGNKKKLGFERSFPANDHGPTYRSQRDPLFFGKETTEFILK